MSDAAAESAPVVYPAWRRSDPALERMAVAFWRRLDLLPPDVAPEARAKELCALATLEGSTVGLTTAAVEHFPFLRARLAMIRAAVAPGVRNHGVAKTLLVESFELLERWSLDHPEEGIKGIGAIVQTRAFSNNMRYPKSRIPGVALDLVGYTAEGDQFRVYWFPHAEVD